MDIQIVIDALMQIIADIVTFLPGIVNSLIIISIRYFVSRIVRFASCISLQRLKIDALVEIIGIMSSLCNFWYSNTSFNTSSTNRFLLMLLSFFITATQLIGLIAVAQVLEQVLALLPSALAAMIVFLFGGFIAAFGLAIGLALGLGARPPVYRILAGYYL